MQLLPITTIITDYYVFETEQLADEVITVLWLRTAMYYIHTHEGLERFADICRFQSP